MCLAIPGKIIEIDGTVALVDYGGVRKKASLLTMPDAKIGEIVIVHAGFAISKIDPEEAQKTLFAFNDLEQAISDEKQKIDGGNVRRE